MVQTNHLHENFDLVDSQGWAVLPLPLDFTRALRSAAESKFNAQKFRRATISAATVPENSTGNPAADVRNDWTCWLGEESDSLVENELMQFLTNVRAEIATYFRIGLSHHECHYAVYPPGHFYQRHSDQTRVNNQRFFSFVIYLNEDWNPAWGGQLRAYNDEKVIFEITPEAGKMILFKSEIEHEVKPAAQPRWSLTGWFRK